MKKLFVALLITVSSFVHAQDMMTSSMILSNTVILTTAASDDDDSKTHADFYINDHRIVENTSISVQHIDKTLLKVKNVKEDFTNDSLVVKYSYNQLSDKSYQVLQKDSLQSFKEKTAYVTVDKIVYKDNQATVLISVLDKQHHQDLIENHNTAFKFFMGIVIFFAILMLLFMASL